MCYDEGTLLAYLDDEVAPQRRAEIAAHLSACEECSAEMTRLDTDRAVTRDALARLQPAARVVELPAAERRTPARTHRDLSWTRWVAVGAAAALVVALVAVAPVRSAAASLLQIFRVTNVQTVTITADDLRAISTALGKGSGRVDLKSFGEVLVDGGSATPQKVTQAQAQAAVDFPVLLPRDATSTPALVIEPARTYRFKLHVSAINEALRSYGTERTLPDSVDGKVFTVRIAPVVLATYGSSAADYRKAVKAGATTGQPPMYVGQTRGPQLVVPDGVDAAELREVLLNLPFLPESVRKQLASVNDWQSTLIIPNVDGTARDITVGDTPAVLFSPQSAARGLRAKLGPLPDNATIVWNDSGVVRAVGGSISEENAIAMAKSTMR